MTIFRLLTGISIAALATGTAHAQGPNTNTSTFNQTGSNNTATVDNAVVGNTNNSSAIVQNGTFNSATVFQRSRSNGSFIQQIGSFQTATHQQSGDFNKTDSRQSGNFQVTNVTQVGAFNSGTVLQSGTYNRSDIRQGYAVDSTVPNGELRATEFNTASVDQNGAGLRSVIDQRAASTSQPAGSENRAFVLQRSTGSSSSVQQTSTIMQESRGNFSSVSQFDGAVGASNLSTITQRNTISIGAQSLNSTTIIQRGLGQNSQVTQNGLSNRATVQMAIGGSGGDGNQSVIVQEGSANSAAYANVRSSAARNQSSVTQTGSSHQTQVYQAGIGEWNSVRQSNGVNSSTYADGAVARADAFVSQFGMGSSASVVQVGDNYGEVVQAGGVGLTTSLNQTDAGDDSGSRAANSAIVSQYGDNNTVLVEQNAVAATATLWQQRGGSDNTATLGQGSGGTAQSSTVSVAGFAAGATGAGTRNVTANIVQGGLSNRTVVYQDGSSLQADAQQFGIGTTAARNSIFVSQTGSGNRATALQASGVGVSAVGASASGNPGDEFYFAGGARSAEVAILQTSSNNTASVQQYGQGQIARVEQSGSGNTASIVQEAGGSNATAVIRQTGSNNSYYIVQTTPGQYIVVTQTGSNNSAANTSVIRRGDGGSNGITPPPGG